MEPREIKTASAASTLQDAHKKLSNILKHSLSDYAKEMIWDEKGEVTPVKESDPTPVQLGKHCLLALQEAERAALGASEVLDRYQRGGITGVVLGEISGIAPFVAATGKPEPVTVEEKAAAEKEMRVLHSERKAQGVDVYYAAQQLSIHAKAIAKIAAEAKLPQETLAQLTSATQSFTSLSPQTVLSGQLPNLSEAFSSLMTTYFSTNRPAAPVRPEQKYHSKEDIECTIIEHTPVNYDDHKPDSYVLIKENHKSWKLVYLDEKHNEHPVDIDDIPQLRQILGTKPASAIIKEDMQAIKANLALRWNPSAQERGEWFLLVEPLRSTMSGTQKLHELFKHFTDDAKARGIELDPTQVDLIERTYAALKKSTIDSDGYYQYLDGDQETPLSQSLKGIFNVIWAINQLSKGYWENPGSAAHLQLIKHAKTALDHYWKIQWPALGGHFGVIGDQLVNAMLVYGKDMAFGRLEQFAQSTHDIEFQQHLRFGVLLESIRPVFDGLESVYQERNLGVLTNPFGYSEETRKALELKLSTAKAEEPNAKEELDALNTIMEKLEWYKELAKDIIQPYPSGSRYGTLPIIETLEKTAQDLLLDLLKLKQTRDFNPSELKAIDKLEDRLLSDLTLDNKRTLLAKKLPGQKKDAHFDSLLGKIHKSIGQNKKHLAEEKSKSYLQRTREAVSSLITLHPQTPWPQEELDLVIDKVGNLRKEPKEKLLNVEKYTEALAQHKKMQKEFALRSLRDTGLIALIEAVRQDPKDDKINLTQKRKLATLLADIRGEDRSDYLTKKHASTIAAEFATNPEQIKIFIQQVHAVDPSLGHALAVEATLANYTAEIPTILQSNDPVMLHQDLINALSRLEEKQILAMLPENPKDEISPQLAIFITLLSTTAITDEKLSSTHQYIATLPDGLTKENFINILVDHYELHQDLLEQSAAASGKPIPIDETSTWTLAQPNREVMNKIGLLLGRLAHADPVMAKAIFKNPEVLGILKQECLLKKASNQVRPDPALYFESLVNTLSFDYPNGRHEQENREFTVFLAANKNIVLEIYKALHSDTTLSDAEIIKPYAENNGQNKLMELIETFTKTCLSPGSHAEMQLRQFFSAMLLCKDNTLIRDTLLELQREAHGSKHTQYLELLTPEASYPFWNQVKEDLLVKPQVDLFKQFDDTAVDLNRQIASSEMSDDAKREFSQKVQQFIAEKKTEVEHVTGKLTAIGALAAALLPASKKDIPLECRHAAQEMAKVKKAVEVQQSEWIKEIQMRSTNQVNLQKLDKQLAKIENTLDHYLEERGSTSAAFNALLGFELQTKKRSLALDYKQQFHELRIKTKSSTESHTELAEKALELGTQLQIKHEALLAESTSEQKSKHAGILGKNITTTQQILKQQPIADDLRKPLSTIARIMATIRSSLTKGALLFGKSQSKTTLNLDEKKQERYQHPHPRTLSETSMHAKSTKRNRNETLELDPPTHPPEKKARTK